MDSKETCPPCSVDSECAEGETCENGVCVAAAEKDVGTPVSDAGADAGADAGTLPDLCDPDPCTGLAYTVCEPSTGKCLSFAGYCEIAVGICVADGAAHPENGCLVCNVAAKKDGWSPRPATFVCRPSAGECDVAEACDGTIDTCPPDAKSIAECRPAAGICDLAETCDGTGDTCPADVKATTECRAAAGACDVAESCDGAGNNCPTDAKSTAVCRAAAGACDVPENCDGANDACPSDLKQSDGTACGTQDQCVVGVCEGCYNVSGCGDLADDGKVCTDPVCGIDHACFHAILADKCLIDGTCYSNGDPKAATGNDNCKVCNPATPTAWTDLTSNEVCNDGLTCTLSACHAGPLCEVTDVTTGCLISQTCYADGVLKAATGNDSCKKCIAATSEIDWTTLTGNEPCDDGNGGTINDMCNASGNCVGTPTNDPPMPQGIIEFDNCAASVTVYWDAATDDSTPPANPQYKLVKAATSAAIDTVAEADAITGPDLVMDWTTNALERQVLGLAEATEYWFAVLVKDGCGNKALYAPKRAVAPAVQTNCVDKGGEWGQNGLGGYSCWFVAAANETCNVACAAKVYTCIPGNWDVTCDFCKVLVPSTSNCSSPWADPWAPQSDGNLNCRLRDGAGTQDCAALPSAGWRRLCVCWQ